MSHKKRLKLLKHRLMFTQLQVNFILDGKFINLKVNSS